MIIKVSKNVEQLSGGESTSFSVWPSKAEYQLALNAIVSWGSLKDLVKFALSGHGYGNTDAMCGITYESDLDDYDREIDNVHIPVGYLQAYAEFSDVKEKNLSEIEYLTILASFFIAKNNPELAKTIRNEIQMKINNDKV